ncbi:PREDICTED: pyrin domain-containing protein 1 [Condylura cristata]|uniref:pyrin domain-containing protein 1 n=1 Tax=Condylura cristata TaxID=143302 RepID=UPI00033454F6|nr:PREDICTED: pyrin domain-containing protein 1 [Condylura cristata]
MGKKRDAILETLENLTADELKKFKLKLGAAKLPEGFRVIPRGALGPLDVVDLTDKMVSFYREDFSAKLAADLLTDMGLQEEAARLQQLE